MGPLPTSEDWVEEGAPGEALGPVLFDLPPPSRRAVDVHEAERDLVEMDRTEERAQFLSSGARTLEGFGPF